MTDDVAAFGSVVTTSGQNTLVIAPPGSGKTELLARRAALLIESLEPHQRILALTFSNRAKANLNSRLVNVLGAEQKRRYITVHNFHGHAAEIVRSHGRTLGVSPDFEMPDKRTQSVALAGHLNDLPEAAAHEMSRTIEEELRDAKQGARSDAMVLEILEKTAHPNTLAVETTRQDVGAVFYDDLLRHAQRLLRIPAIARLYRSHYGAVLVDEFQDLSPQQLDIALRTCDASRTFVGDPLQGIYSWTGARPVEVERTLRRIGGAPHGLGISYRSSPRVLQLLGSVSEQLGGEPLQASEPEKWFEGGITSGVVLPSGTDEAAFIRKTCVEILKRQPNTTIGIICRNAWRRKPIDSDFASSETPHVRWDLALDDGHVIDLIKASVTRLGGNPSAASLKADVLSNVASADVDTAADVIDALEQLAQLTEETGSINGALTSLKTLGDSPEAVTPGVHLLNAHTGKGQQFDWVFVPGFEDGNVPSFLATGRTQLEEEHRVLLVMLSRARHGIVLTRARSLISKKGKPYDTKQSRWASEVRPWLSNAASLAAHIERLPIGLNLSPAEEGGTET